MQIIKNRIDQCVEHLDKCYGEYTPMDYIKLILMAHMPWSDVRYDIAEILCDSETLFSEFLLLRLTFDINELVRLNAADSLCIGKTVFSVRRLYRMAKSRDSLTRAYALMSLLDVVDRREKVSESEKYYQWVAEHLQAEKDIKVRLMVDAQLCQRGYKEYQRDIFRIVAGQIKHGLKNFHFWLIMNVLDDIVNEENQEDVRKVIRKIEKIVGNNEAGRERIEESKRRLGSSLSALI